MKAGVICCAAAAGWLLLLSGCVSVSESDLLSVQEDTAAIPAERPAKPSLQQLLETTEPETAALTEPTIDSHGFPAEEYELLLNGICRDAEKIHFNSSSSQDDLDAMFDSILWEHPELFWVAGWKATVSDCWIDFTVTRIEHCENLEVMQAELENAAQEILRQIPRDAEPYEKALRVHDILVDNTVYDLESAAFSEKKDLSQTAYGCLVQHKAVCSGYAAAFQLLMQKLGIECGYCGGVTNSGENHAWNYIVLDGDYYWIDVTHDDPITEEPQSDGQPLHTYFLINDEMLLRTRTIDKDQPFVPVCSSLEQNYFVRNGAYLEAYSLDAVSEIAERQQEQRQVEILFASEEAFLTAEAALLDANAVFDIPVIAENGSGNIQYQPDETMYVLTIYY